MMCAKMRAMTRLANATLAVAVGLAPTFVAANDDGAITVGYAIAMTGPNAAGAGMTTLPNYRLWVEQVNKRGGLTLPDGSQRLLEAIEYDDKSSNEDLVRSITRLAKQDEVDIILPPWGTGANLAVAPLMDRFGYPQLAVTAITDKAPEFVERWDWSFWLLGGGEDYAEGLVEVMSAARADGSINGKVAMVSVSDGFGIELAAAARDAMDHAGFELVYDESYPLGTSDFGAMLGSIQSSEADSFIAFSYPPGTFGLTKTAQAINYNPSLFYVAIGGAFPVFPVIAEGKLEGVMSLGGMDHSAPGMQEYFQAHNDIIGASPDFVGSAVTYASLQMLEQAIGRVGLDHGALANELSSGTFDTIIGSVTLEDNQLRDNLWWVGQWQGGQFQGVMPTAAPGSVDAIIPKPEW